MLLTFFQAIESNLVTHTSTDCEIPTTLNLFPMNASKTFSRLLTTISLSNLIHKHYTKLYELFIEPHFSLTYWFCFRRAWPKYEISNYELWTKLRKKFAPKEGTLPIFSKARFFSKMQQCSFCSLTMPWPHAKNQKQMFYCFWGTLVTKNFGQINFGQM